LNQEYADDDMSFILPFLPKQRRTGLFSATLDSVEKKDLLKLGLRNPVKIDVKVRRLQN
jgi:ATP-dependent RNA helicase DDX55/SPB4